MCFGTVSFPSKPPPLLRQQRGSTVVHEAGFADCGKELVDLLGRSLAELTIGEGGREGGNGRWSVG